MYICGGNANRIRDKVFIFLCKKREGMLYSITRKGRVAVLENSSFFLKFKTHDRKIALVTHEGIEKDLDLRRLIKWWLININCFAVFLSQPVIRAGPKLQHFKACRSFWNKEKTYNAILKYFILFSKWKRLDKGKKIHICKSCEVYLTPSRFPIADATC